MNKATKSKAKQDDTKDKPWVENYPPLRDWLREHGARCNWQLPMGNPDHPVGYVESYAIPNAKGDVIVVVHAKQLGWNLYTSEQTGKIAETFADAEKRIGLVAEQAKAVSP